MAKGKASSKSARGSKTSMTTTAASRIQGATAKAGGKVAKGSFAARAQKAAAKNSSK
jgi:hypothetical protein